MAASHLSLGNGFYIVLTPYIVYVIANKDQTHGWKHIDKSDWSQDDTQASFFVFPGGRTVDE